MSVPWTSRRSDVSANVVALGTRASQLALVQTHLVADSLRRSYANKATQNDGSGDDTIPEFVVKPMSVAGDRNKQTPLYLLSAENERQEQQQQQNGNTTSDGSQVDSSISSLDTLASRVQAREGGGGGGGVGGRPNMSEQWSTDSLLSPSAREQQPHTLVGASDASVAPPPPPSTVAAEMAPNPSQSTVTPAKSLWTVELEEALLRGEVDMIVHSCKDVPTTLPEGCEMGAILPREAPHDALVVKDSLRSQFKTLEELPEGSIIGTSSIRRIAQLRRWYPKLDIIDVRGNIDTRLRKLDDPSSPYTALILAAAGLERVDLGHRVSSLLKAPTFLHAVGQGALAVEIRTGDVRVREMLKGVGDWKSEWRVGAERGLLRELEGGCSVPVGVETELEEVDANFVQGDLQYAYEQPLAGQNAISKNSPERQPFMYASGQEQPSRLAALTLRACVTSLDGQSQVVLEPGAVLVRDWQESEAWGHQVARDLIAKGARKILDEIDVMRREREEAEKAKK